MGSREGFRYIFKLALDENLIRFSSVSRAFCVWLGLDFDAVSASGAKRIQQTYENAWRCLTDEPFRAECLKGADAQKISLALWAVSADGVEFAEDEVLRILRDGPRHRVVAALRTARQFQNPEVQPRLAALALSNPDYRADGEIAGAALDCLRFLNRIQLDKGKMAELYGYLKLLADSYKKNDHYSRDGLFDAMTRLLARKQTRTTYSSYSSGTETNEWGIPVSKTHSSQEPMVLDELDKPSESGELSLRDDLCGYLEQMSADSRNLFLRQVVRDGSASPRQREALVRAMGDRSGWCASLAWQNLKDVPLTDEEVKIIEGFLRFKDGTIRQHITLKLLGQSPEKLGQSIQRLRAD
jgi:hypothetical protein